jgi:hypothetical protein
MVPATAAIVLVPLVRTLVRAGAGEAAGWLRTNEQLVNSALDAAVGNASKPVTRAAISFLYWLSAKVADEPLQLLGPPTASDLPLEQAEPLYEAMTIAAKISGTEPGRMVELKNREPRLLPPERRVAIGIARRGKEEVPLLLLAAPNPKAEKLVQAANSRIQLRVVGQASSRGASRVNPPTVPDADHRPGRSVSHCLGNAGSLGAYVTWNDEKSGRAVTGFLGASHVMGLLGKASERDWIHSPGPPDKDRNMRHRYGRLFNFRNLVHVDDPAEADAFVNDCDNGLGATDEQMRTA